MFIKEFLIGFGKYFKGHRVISKNKLWTFVLIPGGMGLVYIAILIFLGYNNFSDISDYIMTHWMPGFMKAGVTNVITTILLWLVLFVMWFISYKIVVLTLFSPLLSFLSELIEKKEYHREGPPFSVKQIFRDLWRGLVINLRNLFFTLLFIVPAWLLVFIPVVGAIVSPILILFIQFYFDGFGFTDYTLERKQFSIKDSIRFGKRNRWRIIGVGMGFWLLFMIPIIGWILAPAYATAAATLAALDKISE